MSKITKYLVYSLPILVVVAGFLLFSSKDRGSSYEEGYDKKALTELLDYAKLTELAKNRPNGEKYLQFIRENEAALANGSASDRNFYGETFVTLGFNLHVLGDDVAAIEAYQEGLRLLPENSYGLNNIATSYKDLGEFEKAEAAYKKLTRVLSGDSSAVINYAQVYRIVHPDDERGFLDIISEGISVTAGDNLANILVYAGGYFKDSGDKKRAIEYFLKLVELFPDNELYKSELSDLKK